MIEIYTSTTLRVLFGDVVEIELDVELSHLGCARFPIQD